MWVQIPHRRTSHCIQNDPFTPALAAKGQNTDQNRPVSIPCSKSIEAM